jgi:ubiquinone/menaquinone biosynthesis C-methylase UbiE
MPYNSRVAALQEDDLELGINEYMSLASLSVRQSIHLNYSEPPDRLEETTIAAAALSPESSVIDIGPGNGSFLRGLIESGHRGIIAALDRSMTAARSVAAIGGPASLQGDACRLPFADTVFDAVFARHMLYHVSDVFAALREFKRVLRLSGKCVTVVNHAEQAPRLSDLLRHRVAVNGVRPPDLPQVDATILPDMLRSVFGNTSVTRRVGHLVFHRPEPLIALGAALLGFYGVAPDSPMRADIEAQLADDIQNWFAHSGQPWSDSKGFIICLSVRED